MNPLKNDANVVYQNLAKKLSLPLLGSPSWMSRQARTKSPESYISIGYAIQLAVKVSTGLPAISMYRKHAAYDEYGEYGL